MASLLARDLALMKLGWWGGAITSHWTGARSAGLSSAGLGCLVRRLRARSIPTLGADERGLNWLRDCQYCERILMICFFLLFIALLSHNMDTNPVTKLACVP